jgi:hypothetical protein
MGIPNPKFQIPKNCQIPISKAASKAALLGFEIWEFLGAGDLGFGTLA